MGFHGRRQMLLASFLLVLLQVGLQTEARPQEVITVAADENETEVVIKKEGGDGDGDGDDDDSSSEETVEDSEETARRRREVGSDDALLPRAGIPGQQIVPILLEAVLPSPDAVGDRIARSLQFLNNVKSSLDGFSEERK
ncbi:antennal-specific protein OS-C isoform X1 [Drosophila pseudoobscura]|uniref:Antennal-specific protein OS-C isoform X1 n=1 Tax=Drosophila pseudoobscura pseudoobscura TaxID=46245 RepID=A0A6I8V2Z9_DROPS|nr:antennal-specific protein OS-C isoform X1 [Drosophila pseudoobscura]